MRASIFEMANMTPRETTIHINCRIKNALSPVNEFIVTSPNTERMVAVVMRGQSNPSRVAELSVNGTFHAILVCSGDAWDKLYSAWFHRESLRPGEVDGLSATWSKIFDIRL